jgi:hypothetical protein
MDKLTAIITATIVLILVVVLITILSFPTLQPQNGEYYYSFEDGFERWEAGSDVPEDPNRMGEPVDWQVVIEGNISFSGDRSVLLYIDGRQDDGTIWIQRQFTFETEIRNANVKFQFWSESESFNTLAAVVGYVGNTTPEVEDDFQVLGSANEAEGWKSYSFASEIDDSGNVYVAIGISVRWETQMTYYIDDVSIVID